ncbi:hypothetical protein [Brevibacillus dissolubilis]|uniref:hypothetical protein n=1 Tax=Brevibacillus dissolubilis TaxID=1844116 RepID=UPI0011173AE1|nr:hypothetical protein [Brevibacillus dissolubilis]
MNYTDLMNLKHVYFLGVTEPEENSLRLFFGRTKSIPEPLVIGDKRYEDAHSIIIDEDLPVIQIDFETYIGYSVLNESYTTWDDAEEFEGKVFRIYSKSKYLDFIKVGTFASEDYPGPFKHYGMCCLNHIVDVVSTSEPVVREAD